MGFKEDFASYLTIDGYASPEQIEPGTIRSCDNETMYTSEMYIAMQKNGLAVQADLDKWEQLMDKSMIVPGLTVRAPGDTAIDAPDNIYGILAASKILNKPQVAYSILQYGFYNLGFFNTSNPNHIKNSDGSWNWPSMQWRQLQMAFASYTASGMYKFWKFWLWPIMIYTGLAIAVSCVNTNTSDTDSRRLCWLLIQATQEDSWFCRMMAKIWFNRLYKDYGPTGMKAVASIYYNPKPANAFSTWWIN
jgi:hypothetical protein